MMNSRWKNWIQENEDANADRIEMLEKMVLGERIIEIMVM